jgi:hypothetical protein
LKRRGIAISHGNGETRIAAAADHERSGRWIESALEQDSNLDQDTDPTAATRTAYDYRWRAGRRAVLESIRSVRFTKGDSSMRRSAVILGTLLAFSSVAALAAEEGTRHIAGDGVDMFFMNDKVFGTASGHPLWAIYNCGSDIKGEIDVGGSYQKFAFEYRKEGDRKIVGTFGDRQMSLGDVDKTDSGFTYHVFVDQNEHLFTIRYEKLDGDHMLNSIIEGSLGEGRDFKLVVDGHLCPFATTGIILITAGSSLLG